MEGAVAMPQIPAPVAVVARPAPGEDVDAPTVTLAPAVAADVHVAIGQEGLAPTVSLAWRAAIAFVALRKNAE